jgi:hypothetical protein
MIAEGSGGGRLDRRDVAHMQVRHLDGDGRDYEQVRSIIATLVPIRRDNAKMDADVVVMPTVVRTSCSSSLQTVRRGCCCRRAGP